MKLTRLFTVFLIFLHLCALSSCTFRDEDKDVFYGSHRGSGNHHIVQKGETVYRIAQRYNIPTSKLINTNNLEAPYIIYIGQKLKIPSFVQYYVVKKGDTLSKIAQYHRLNYRDIAKQNNIKYPYHIKPGDKIAIKGSVVRPSRARDNQINRQQVASKPRIVTQPQKRRFSQATNVDSTKVPAVQKPIPKPPSISNKGFLWPVRGKVVLGFGMKKTGKSNDGINIAVREGTKVRASENGVVAYAGNELRGFGNLLLIKHKNRWVTAYAHNKKLLVKRGDIIKRGQIIAYAGKTGNVISSQLHFEIRKGTKALNPLRYLK